MHEMVRVPHAVECLIDFNLLCDRGQQRVVLKSMTNDHFLVFLIVWFLLPKFLGEVKE